MSHFRKFGSSWRSQPPGLAVQQDVHEFMLPVWTQISGGLILVWVFSWQSINS